MIRVLCFGALAALLSATALAQVSGTGTATLSWTPPTQYEDGSPLAIEDIVGYVIFYGPESLEGRCDPGEDSRPRPTSRTDTSCFPASVFVANGAVQSRVIDLELAEPTTMYFAAVAEAATGFSVYSNEATKTFTLEVDNLPPGEPMTLEVEITMECTTSEPGRTCRFVIE